MHHRFIAFHRLVPALNPTRLVCWVGAVVGAGVGVVFGAGAASAQFSISRFTVDGGGGAGSSGGFYALSGTIGQPDAGRLSGANFTLNGGFWMGGGGVVSGVEDGEDGEDTASDGEGDGDVASPTSLPLTFRVYPPSPNPVTAQMALAFDLPTPSSVRAVLYDASGRLVRVLADGALPAGKHQRNWNRSDQAGARVPAGIYFLRLDAGTDRDQRKIVVLD